MDDEEDVKRIIEVLNYTKQENLQEFEYEEFINCEGSDIDENEETANDIDDYFFYDLSNTDISKLSTYDPRSTLKPEERIVIDSCSDPELKNLLLLNRTKNMQLIQLYKQMKDLLIECQKNITEKSAILKAHVASNKGQTNSTGAWRLAAPYFKDKQLYCSPPNDDVLRKKNNNELCIYDLSSSAKWSSFECEKLIRAVKLNYNINQQNAIMKKIQDIEGSSLENNEELLGELKNRMKELRANDNSEVPPLHSNEYIDWSRVAEVFLKDKHSSFECESFWHIYLHPYINKSPWTPAENTKVKALVEKYRYQNWDRIAEELGTNRTGFTVCMYYYGNLHEKFKQGEFTFEEDTKLLDLVYQYRMGSYIPWVKIVRHFESRTRPQLHYRYTYYLSQNNKNKGKFTEAEDVLLMILVDRFGKNFKKCSEHLPTRSMVQCKSRYNSNLQCSIKKGSFTVEEDEIILKYAKEHGLKSWTNLTKRLQRSRGQIRQRYLTVTQFLESNPDASLNLVPRRKHNAKSEKDSFHHIRIIADEYRNSPEIPSLEEIQRVLRSRKKELLMYEDDVGENNEEESSETVEKIPASISSVNIDDMLTDFFCNSYKINTSKNVSFIHLRRTVSDVERALKMLNVELCIPESFDTDYRLDNLDVAILNSLLEKEQKSAWTDCTNLSFKTGGKNIVDLIPPNLNTVVGLRSLLIKFSHYKSAGNKEMMKYLLGMKRLHNISGLRTEFINYLVRLPSDIRKSIENEHKLFYKRFFALFKWSAIMTLENPSAELQSIFRSKTIEIPIQVKRTYSRADRNSKAENSIKRLKVSELPKIMPKVVPLKLTPVTNKSVIEDLLRNKNKKLFYLDNIKCGDLTKTLIREVPLSNINENLNSSKINNLMKSNNWKELSNSASTSNEASSSNQERFQFNTKQGECVITEYDDDNSNGGNCSIDNDEEDVKKLDMFLSQQFEEEDNDLEDFNKLDTFLKKEVETDSDSNDQSTL